VAKRHAAHALETRAGLGSLFLLYELRYVLREGAGAGSPVSTVWPKALQLFYEFWRKNQIQAERVRYQCLAAGAGTQYSDQIVGLPVRMNWSMSVRLCFSLD
jgi:hypothetical protein